MLATAQNLPARMVRAARLPMPYLQAVAAIEECLDIRDAVQWSHKSDALAAWARMYSDDLVGIKAKRLKLLACRRMEKLAAELAAATKKKGKGRPIAAKGVLRKNGLQEAEATCVAAIGKLSQDTFDRAVKSDSPPTPKQLVRNESPLTSQLKRSMSTFRSEIARYHPESIARLFSPEDAAKVRLWNEEIFEWMSAFDRALKK